MIYHFYTKHDTGKSIIASTLANVGGFFGIGTLAKAFFGSCPTIYSDNSEGLVLERYYQRVQTRYQVMRETGTVAEQDIEWLMAAWHGRRYTRSE